MEGDCQITRYIKTPPLEHNNSLCFVVDRGLFTRPGVTIHCHTMYVNGATRLVESHEIDATFHCFPPIRSLMTLLFSVILSTPKLDGTLRIS